MPSRSHSSPELQINTKKPPPRVIHKNVCGLATTKLHSLAFPAKTNYKAQTLAPFGRKINFAIAPPPVSQLHRGDTYPYIYIYIYAWWRWSGRGYVKAIRSFFLVIFALCQLAGALLGAFRYIVYYHLGKSEVLRKARRWFPFTTGNNVPLVAVSIRM